MKYPFIKQRGLNDCGPACLEMIIEYYKGYVGLDNLTYMTNTTKDGTSAYNLKETANKLGFNCFATKEIKTYPSISLVKVDKIYNHFIVIYKKIKDKYLIADPNYGIKKISINEYNNVKLDIILNFIPKQPILKQKQHKLKNYYKIVFKNNKILFSFIMIVSLIFIIISYIYVLIYQKILYNPTKNLFIIYLLLFTIQSILTLLKNLLIIKLDKNINKNLINDILKKLIMLPYVYYKNHTTGEIISRINDTSNVRETIIYLILKIVEVPLIIIYILLMLKINSKITSLLITILIIYYLSTIIYKKSISLKTNTLYTKKEQAYSTITSSILCYEYVKGCNVENKILKNNIEKFNEYIDYEYKLNKLYIKKNTIDKIILGIGEVLIIYLGLKNLSLDKFIILNHFYNHIIETLQELSDIIIKYNESEISYKRIYEFDIKEQYGQIKQVENYNITINNLTHSYGLKKVINKLNLKINHKDKILIYGKSGSGKSTLVKILKGYIENQNLLLGNKSINCYSRDALNKIVYISNNELLFNDTIYNNLMCDDEIRIKKYAELLYIQNIYKDDNQKLNMLILENGFNLSQGQRQQITLLRGILNPFEILILDESTSQMDNKLERNILKNLINEFSTKTIIFVSHRLNNKDLFDKCIEII